MYRENVDDLSANRAAEEPLLELRDLKKYFPVGSTAFFKVKKWLKALDGISFTINQRETFALVGESGCGKTTTAKTILLLEYPTAGAVLWQGENAYKLSGRHLQQYRTSVQAVFQDPYSSLNPRMRVGTILAEPLQVNTSLSPKAVRDRVAELLMEVALEPESVERYPHEFSGGQRQRIAVARAIALHPKLIVLDEPVSALDVSLRSQVMNLLKDLQGKYGMSYLLIAHHLGTVRYMSHRVGVMYLGKLVELAETEELYTNRLHPYTKALMAAALPFHPDVQRGEIPLRGEIPSPVDPPLGCRLHPRCPMAMPICRQVEPQLQSVSRGHWVACHLC